MLALKMAVAADLLLYATVHLHLGKSKVFVCRCLLLQIIPCHILRQFCYRGSFLSSTSISFLIVQRTFSLSCRALLGELYLFISYALRCSIAFRNLLTYLGVNLHFCLVFTDFARFNLRMYSTEHRNNLYLPRRNRCTHCVLCYFLIDQYLQDNLFLHLPLRAMRFLLVLFL